MRNIRLLIEYEGTSYHGWQIQPGMVTVQGVIQEKIAQITQQRCKLIGASRTDSGVHAWGQVANFLTSSPIDLTSLQRGLNSLLPPDIVIKDAGEVPLEFHARFSAKGKLYEYRILHRSYPSALWRNFCWHIPWRLDIEPMRECAKMLLGCLLYTSPSPRD